MVPDDLLTRHPTIRQTVDTVLDATGVELPGPTTWTWEHDTAAAITVSTSGTGAVGSGTVRIHTGSRCSPCGCVICAPGRCCAPGPPSGRGSTSR